MNFPIPTREQFIAMVGHFQSSENLSTIQAVYKAFDHCQNAVHRDPSYRLACGKQCAHCCHLLVSLTDAEGRAIEQFLDERPSLFDQLKSRIRTVVQTWRHYKLHSFERAKKSDTACMDWLGQPCMFLDPQSHECQIYPVRPLGCRSLSSQTRCTAISDVVNLNASIYPWSEWAYELILREDVARGQVAIRALPEWAAQKLKDRL